MAGSDLVERLTARASWWRSEDCQMHADIDERAIARIRDLEARGIEDYRCDRCRHWVDDEDDWQAGRIGFKRCMAVRPRWKIETDANEGREYPCRPKSEPFLSPIPAERQARIDAWQAREDQAIAQERSYVIDGSEYRAELWTGPDFFCAKFTALQEPALADQASISDNPRRNPSDADDQGD